MTNMFARIFRRSESQPKTIRVLVVEGGGRAGYCYRADPGTTGSRTGWPFTNIFRHDWPALHQAVISVMALATDSLTDAYDLSTIFNVRSKDVFRRAPNPVRLPPLLRGPRYLAEGFMEVASDVLGEGWLSDCKIPTLVTSYLIEEGRLKVFGSLNEDLDDDYRLVDVRAGHNCGTPRFSPRHIITSQQGKSLWGGRWRRLCQRSDSASHHRSSPPLWERLYP